MEAILKEIIEGQEFELLIDSEIFPKDIVLKAAYNFLDRGYFFFRFDENKNIILQFKKKSDYSGDAKTLIGNYSDELLDTYLRDKLEKDNKVIREAIVTKAINGPLDTKNFISLDTDANASQKSNEIDFDKDIDEILKEIENDPDLKIDEEEIERILREIENETQIEKPIVNVNPESIE